LHPRRHIHVGLAGGCLQLGVIASPVKPHLLRQTPQPLVGFEVLRQSHFDQGSAHTSIAIFKRMYGFKPQVGYGCTHQPIGLAQAGVEPVDQLRHVRRHIDRIGGLVVNDVWFAQSGRDDLHRFSMVAVGTSADFLDTAAPGGKERCVPATQHVVIQGLLTLGDSCLQHVQRGFGACIALNRFGIQQALAPCSRGTDRIDLQDFTLDLRGSHGFIGPALQL